ncbi:negative transcriptional regulator-like protein [Ceratocystis lukuohia]|uniref:Negative transcriptional regulator-like protein n=1 Tax=Ceratocystis lukuohia TaxID=2019550 RepID=A0ABR4MLC9_9PEZI
MHLPSCNAEKRPEVLHDFIRHNPLGILTTSIRSETYPLLQSSHIPWVLDNVGTDDSQASLGRLCGHIARQNPQSKAIIESLAQNDSTNVLADDVLVLFNGPVHHYVTAKFYKKTKPETGKTVPTWDYEAVEVYGKARIYHDTKSSEFKDFLSAQLDKLSNHCETSIMGYGKEGQDAPWKVTDAPERYIDLMMKNIIGIEIEITSIAGRFKWSQEKIKGDRDGIIEGFASLPSPYASELAEKVANQARIFDAAKEK